MVLRKRSALYFLIPLVMLIMIIAVGISHRRNTDTAFTRPPYLSWSADPATTMTIRYGTERHNPDKVYYGIGDQLNHFVYTNIGNEKKINLRDLKADTKYSYRIGDSGRVYSFHTAPQKVVPFTFVVYGDSRDGKMADKLELNRKILSEKPAFLLSVGDIVENGNTADLWQHDFFASVKEISPYFPIEVVLGNHERESPLFSYYFSYPNSGRWYSFVYSNALFIGLDSETDYRAGSPQYKYLEKTLKNSQAYWKIVYLHSPPYSTNSGHHSDMDVRKWLCPLFEKYNVAVVFAGHNHCYERTKPIVQNRVDRKNGVVYITSGGGGAELSPFIPYNQLDSAEKRWSLIRSEEHHYVVVRIDGTGMALAAKKSNGTIIDGFIITKSSIPKELPGR